MLGSSAQHTTVRTAAAVGHPLGVTARAAAVVAARIAPVRSSPCGQRCRQRAAVRVARTGGVDDPGRLGRDRPRPPTAIRATPASPAPNTGRRPAARSRSFSCSFTTTGSASASTSAGRAAYGARLITIRAPARDARRAASATTSRVDLQLQEQHITGPQRSTGPRSRTGQPGVGAGRHHDGVLTGRVHDDDRCARLAPRCDNDAGHVNTEGRQPPPVRPTGDVVADCRDHRGPAHRPALRQPPDCRPSPRSRARCPRRARSRRRRVGGRRSPGRLRSTTRRPEPWTSPAERVTTTGRAR